MKVYIASERKPKIDAVEAVFSKFSRALGCTSPIEFIARSVDTAVSEMPLSTDELMQGAYLRAQNLMKLTDAVPEADTYFVGLEGGFFRPAPEKRRTEYFLQSWAYVCTAGLGHYGASGAVRVPDAVRRAVVDNGIELGAAIDDFAAGNNIRNKGGAFSVFTGGARTRQASFETALTYALAPFYNQTLYGQERSDLNHSRKAYSQ